MARSTRTTRRSGRPGRGPYAQCAIWRNLADLNKIPLADDVIRAFAEEHPAISGRDVKNLLKLASFIVAQRGGEVTRDVLDFALQYKPTTSDDELTCATVDRHGVQ